MLIENEPPNVDARLMMLMEQVSRTNEQIVMLMVSQGRPNVGPRVVIQSGKNDLNTLYEKFRKRGATEFHGKEEALQADEWLEHTCDVFETVICDNKQRVVLAASMLCGVDMDWWKSVRDAYKTMPNATIWTTFQDQFRRHFYPGSLAPEEGGRICGIEAESYDIDHLYTHVPPIVQIC